MHWYAKDVARFFSSDSSKQKTLDEMLDSMQPILEGKNAEAAKLLAQKIKKTRETTGKVFHSFEYSKAQWSFDAKSF